MRRLVLIALTAAASLIAAGSADAAVVNMGAAAASTGNASYGVAFALAPPSFTQRADAGVTPTTAAAPCVDPALSTDLLLPNNGLCYQGGPVMHSNESFALTWDPIRSYWQTTRDYVEQYLSDVAAGSGTLTSPYAVATQYSDAGGRVQNSSAYGGGCIDYGDPGGYTCQFGDTSGSGTGNNYPANGCTPTGSNQFYELANGTWTATSNSICLTDAQVRTELAGVIGESGLLSQTRTGYTPLVVLLTPPGVEVCLDGTGGVCSANGSATASFCSYHSQVDVGGTEVAYLVQPWVAQWATPTGCVDPGAPTLPTSGSIDATTAAQDVGAQLVSPLSQSQIAAMTDPALNGWMALNGSEIDDHGCIPLAGLDGVTLGSDAYDLQWEFNNAGVMQSDPNSPVCDSLVNLAPKFVLPTSVEKGDVLELDGSTTVSSLIVPKANYAWDFGDGSTAVGPSVSHSYSAAGSFTVKLSVTDRGGNVATLSQTVTVLGSNGVTPPPPPPPSVTNTSFQVHLQLLPQGLKGLLRHGVSLRVISNKAADGFVSLYIPRSAARRAHIKVGSAASVRVGRGTVSSVVPGMVDLRVHLSSAMARKLGHLRHVTLTVRMALTALGGSHVAVDVAGRY